MFDMRSGYHHITLSPESQAKSAFVIGGPHGGKFEFKLCPFGLAQAPAYFQRLVDEVLRGLPFAFGYLDDILIFSPDIDTHLYHIEILFQRLREAKLKLKESKCNFLKKHVQYLGHLILGEGMEPVPEKLESIKQMPTPRTPREIKQFLGLIGYYRKFIPKFSDVARPLMNLTKKDIPYEWTSECPQTFEMLKNLLTQEPILKYPDPGKLYTLYTDASKYAWSYCYIVGLGPNCKFIDLLFKRLVITFIKINFLNYFIVLEIIFSQTDTLTEELMYLR